MATELHTVRGRRRGDFRMRWCVDADTGTIFVRLTTWKPLPSATTDIPAVVRAIFDLERTGPFLLSAYQWRFAAARMVVLPDGRARYSLTVRRREAA